METIIYGIIGMIIIVSGSFVITFSKEIGHKFKNMAMKIRGL